MTININPVSLLIELNQLEGEAESQIREANNAIERANGVIEAVKHMRDSFRLEINDYQNGKQVNE